MAAQQPRFLVVEDDLIGARTVGRVLGHYAPVCYAGGAQEAYAELPGATLRGAVVGSRLQDATGPDVVGHIRRGRPDLPILVLADRLERTSMNRLHLLGAEVVAKPVEVDNVRSFAERAMRADAPAMDSETLARHWSHVFGLSDTEAEVLRLVMLGFPRSEIPGQMGRSNNTVKTYVRRLLQTGSRSLEGLARTVLQRTLLTSNGRPRPALGTSATSSSR